MFLALAPLNWETLATAAMFPSLAHSNQPTNKAHVSLRHNLILKTS